MDIEEVAKKFGLKIEEVKPDYYKVLNPVEISLSKFSDCFDKCILIYTEPKDILNDSHWIVDERGVLNYFTPFLDEEHSSIYLLADADGLTGYYSDGHDHDFKEESGIDSVFLKGEMP